MFITTGAITDLGGTPVVDWDKVQVSVWPAGDRTTSTGESYDYTAEAELDAAAELSKPNRRLLVDGDSYMIVSAVAMEIVPHVALRLRRVGSAGGV